MVCDGPDPPDNSPHNLSPPPMHLITNGNHHEDSDEEQNEHFGYEPLPQGPDAPFFDPDSSDEEAENNEAPTNGVPDIEPMEASLTREVWNGPRRTDPIEMDNERAQQLAYEQKSRLIVNGYLHKWTSLIPKASLMYSQSRRKEQGSVMSDLQALSQNTISPLVMSAMANFALPQDSIPDWAQSVSEEQWKQTLNDKIEKIRSNR